jgi:hypothetical protein
MKLHCNEAIMEFADPDSPVHQITLIEYAMRRIGKVVTECAYCAPHFVRYTPIHTIVLTLELSDGTKNLDGYAETLEFYPVTDKYPSNNFPTEFFKDHPKWNANEIRQLAEGGTHAR